MKKLLLALFFCLLFISNINAKEDVYIEEVTIEENSTTAVEENTPVIDGLKIKFDVTFNNLNDFIKYKVVIVNNSNNDYEIDTSTSFKDSDYIKYDYIFNNDSKIVKRNSRSTIYINISYINLVPNDRLDNGTFVENNTFNIGLTNEENPDTGQMNISLIILCVLLLVLSLHRLFIRNSKNEITLVLVLCMILIPASYAVSKIQ